MINLIVSIANNGCIGGNNTLLWKQSEDLKRFKELTTGKVIIMGQNTWFSLPFRPLKNRINIVITDDLSKDYTGAIIAKSIEESIKLAQEFEKEIFIIGGGSIYRQFLPLSDKLYITRINVDIDGDTYFPEIDENIWKKISEESHECDDKNQYDYTYQEYLKSN